MRHVYETIITNTDGLTGVVKADSGYTFTTDGVKNADLNHTNPEQLIGASWATCLAATLHSVLKLKGIEPISRVEVKVDLFLDEITRFACGSAAPCIYLFATPDIRGRFGPGAVPAGRPTMHTFHGAKHPRGMGPAERGLFATA